jgi:serine/threonine protein kinase
MPRLDIDDFILHEQLGVGTVGTIYRVTEKSTGEVYALKLLSPMVSSDQLIVSRFTREMIILEKLHHPNIIAYHGGGRRNGQLFYVMELIQGGTLKQLLSASGPFGWRETAECGRQISAALQHAHNHGIIHRDLKPGNVFLTGDATLKLGDFGIARDLREQDITEVGLTVGTYAYMAPELVRGQRAITGQVDLYALGCVLFEMLTGRTPYVGDNFAQIFEQHLHTPPPHPSELGIHCPRRMDDLIVQLLAKKPEDRPFNARTVQGILGELTEPEPGRDAAQPEDRAASEVRPARELLRDRLQRHPVTPRTVSWTKLGWLVAAILGVVIVALMMERFS